MRMFVHVLSHFVEVHALFVRTEVCIRSQRRIGVDRYKKWRGITMAHKSQSECLNTMIHVHASPDFRVKKITGFPEFGVPAVVVTPGKLTDYILGSEDQ